MAGVSRSVDFVLSDEDLLKSIFERLDLQDICKAASTGVLWAKVRVCAGGVQATCEGEGMVASRWG